MKQLQSMSRFVFQFAEENNKNVSMTLSNILNKILCPLQDVRKASELEKAMEKQKQKISE